MEGAKRISRTISEEEAGQYSELSKRRRVGFAARKDAPLYYHSYLGLDKLLTSQSLMSASDPAPPTGSDKIETSDVAAEASSFSGGAEGCCPHTAAPAPASLPQVPPMSPPASPSSASPASPSSSSSSSSSSSLAADLEAKNRTGAHDEHLFIVIHQSFELWFKQVLWELGDARRLLNEEYVPERAVGTVITRLTRCVEIFRLLVEQFTILETMTPLGFLEFRDYLFPASGFQSLQWRKIEQGVGLEPEARVSYGQRKFCSHLSEAHRSQLEAAALELPSLHDLVSNWLERMPFVYTSHPEEDEKGGRGGGGDDETSTSDNGSGDSSGSLGSSGSSGSGGLSSLWEHYRHGVRGMLEADREFVRRDMQTSDTSEGEGGEEEGGGGGGEAVKNELRVAKEMAEIDAREEALNTILDPKKFEEARARGEVRFSHKAMQAALLISLYQDEPVLNQASRLLRAIIDVDELMTMWRQRHALMVHRMIGVKMGTGGSSGFHYLASAAVKHRVFKDLFNLSSFLVPRHELPPLPATLRAQLSFALDYEPNSGGSAGPVPRSSPPIPPSAPFSSIAASAFDSAAFTAAAAAAAATAGGGGVCPVTGRGR